MKKVLLAVLILLSLASITSCGMLPSYQEIVSIRQDSQVIGNFFLGSGSIDSIGYYYFYFKSGDGYELGKQPIKNTVIIERNNVSPHIERIKDNWFSSSAITEIYGKSAKIYVPEGTILMNFNLE